MRDKAEDARTAFLQERYYSIVAEVIARVMRGARAIDRLRLDAPHRQPALLGCWRPRCTGLWRTGARDT